MQSKPRGTAAGLRTFVFVKLAFVALVSMTLASLATGCNNNPFATGQKQAGAFPTGAGQQPYEAQITDLNRRVGQYAANNNELTAQLAQSQQQLGVVREQVTLLQRRLDDTSNQLKDAQVARQTAERQVEAVQASLQRRGAATITANNSVKQTLATVSIPGVEVRADGDVIRIELPSDALFRPGTAQLQPTATATLDQVSDAILRNYSRQRIGIEGHLDAPPAFAGPPSSAHQLTGLQAQAVMDQLLTRNRLPAAQLFTVAHGANHPRYTSMTAEARARNRRIEIVIYPETF